MEAEAVLERTATAPTAYRYRWVALFVILTVEVMDLLDALVTNIAGPSIRADLGGSYSLIQWLGAAYTLAMAIGLLTGGRLGDIFGRRRMFLIGAIGFTLASLACGLAQTPTELIAGRAVQGLFGAVMLPQGLGLIKEMFPPEEIAAAFGAFGPIMGLSAVGGPILAGFLVDADVFGWAWRTIFAINIPIGVAALLVGLKVLPPSRQDRSVHVDLTSALVASAAMALLIYPLIQGRELWLTGTFRYANTYPTAIALAASGRVDLEAIITGHYGLEGAEDALKIGREDPASVKVMVHP